MNADEIEIHVIESVSGDVKQVMAHPDQTFREACQEIAPMDITEWCVLNSDGEDISDRKVSSYRGKVQIAPSSVTGG
ncbi:MAG: hypothetical protein GF308_19015 [Candidatus Heimdallarchaeota archaeon]|nr:hypothetical protein [Candidatus Heimdallarchaeota archaeon]